MQATARTKKKKATTRLPTSKPEPETEKAFKVVDNKSIAGRRYSSMHGLAAEMTAAKEIAANHLRTEKLKIRKVDLSFAGNSYMLVNIQFEHVVESMKGWRPSHALELPPESMFSGFNGEYSPEELRPTRERAMQEAAANNTESLFDHEGPRSRGIRFWWSVIELGEAMEKHSIVDINLHGRIGHADLALNRPVRIIEPTPDEIAKFAPDRWVWEGKSIPRIEKPA